VAEPEVVAAIDDLVREGVLPRTPAVRLRRAASGSLISVREELRFLLWAGVLLIAAGAGLLVKTNLDRIGPVTVAVVLGVASAACLIWCRRRAPAFTWGEAPATGFVLDYVLLLGALLAAADLAFVEVKFTPLGPSWAYHLLIVAVVYTVLALRFDSKTMFSLALTSFAAWRGVALSRLSVWDLPDENRFFVEALVCALFFIGIGQAGERFRLKPHFEPVAVWLGWILMDGALLQRMFDADGNPLYALVLAACGAALAWFAWDDAKIGRFALGVGMVATGIGGAMAELVSLGDAALSLVVIVLAGSVLAVILRAHRAMKARP